MVKIPHVVVNVRDLEPIKELIDLLVGAYDLFVTVGSSTCVTDVDKSSYYRVDKEYIYQMDQWLRNFHDLILQLEMEE